MEYTKKERKKEMKTKFLSNKSRKGNNKINSSLEEIRFACQPSVKKGDQNYPEPKAEDCSNETKCTSC